VLSSRADEAGKVAALEGEYSALFRFVKHRESRLTVADKTEAAN
jgi:hypothetical protein